MKEGYSRCLFSQRRESDVAGGLEVTDEMVAVELRNL